MRIKRLWPAAAALALALPAPAIAQNVAPETQALIAEIESYSEGDQTKDPESLKAFCQDMDRIFAS